MKHATPKTLHDKLCLGLLRLGYSKLPKRNKYTMFEKKQDQIPSCVLFVGKNGALRQYHRANAALSIPCSDKFRQTVLSKSDNPFDDIQI
jgi:hypothetical protein